MASLAGYQGRVGGEGDWFNLRYVEPEVSLGKWIFQLMFMAQLMCVLGLGLRLLHMGRYCYYSHFMAKGTEALRGKTHLSTVTQ